MNHTHDSTPPSAGELRLERALRDQAPQALTSPATSIRAAVMDHLHQGTSAAPRSLRVRFGILLPLGIAAALALAWLMIPGRPDAEPLAGPIAFSFDPTPVIRPAGPRVPGPFAAPIAFPFDPTPVPPPAGRFVPGPIDEPLKQEASLIARDTRRAMRLVVDSLPRPGVSRP